MKANPALIVAGLALIESVTSAPVPVAHSNRGHVDEVVKKQRVFLAQDNVERSNADNLIKREPLSPSMLSQSMKQAPLKKWVFLTIGALGGAFALGAPDEWSPRSVRKKPTPPPQQQQQQEQQQQQQQQPQQPQPQQQYAQGSNQMPSQAQYQTYNQRYGGYGGYGGTSNYARQRRSIDDDLKPAEIKISKASQEGLQRRGFRFLMDKYQWAIDGFFLGVTVLGGIRAAKYLSSSPNKEQQRLRNEKNGQLTRNPQLNGPMPPVQGMPPVQRMPPVQFQGQGGQTAQPNMQSQNYMNSNGVNQPMTRRSLVEEETISPSTMEHGVRPIRRGSELEPRTMLTWVAGATGLAGLWKLVLQPFATKRDPDGAKYAAQMKQMEEMPSDAQPTQNTLLQKQNYYQQQQWKYLTPANRGRIMLPQFNN